MRFIDDSTMGHRVLSEMLTVNHMRATHTEYYDGSMSHRAVAAAALNHAFYPVSRTTHRPTPQRRASGGLYGIKMIARAVAVSPVCVPRRRPSRQPRRDALSRKSHRLPTGKHWRCLATVFKQQLAIEPAVFSCRYWGTVQQSWTWIGSIYGLSWIGLGGMTVTPFFLNW